MNRVEAYKKRWCHCKTLTSSLPVSRVRRKGTYLGTVALLLCCQLAASKPLHEGRMHSSRHLVKREAKKQPKGGDGSGQAIPKLLHYIYLPGLQAFKAAKPDSRLDFKHFEGCQKIHSHWDSLFWDEALGLDLIKEFYRSFLPVYESYNGWGKQVRSRYPPPPPHLNPTH